MILQEPVFSLQIFKNIVAQTSSLDLVKQSI